MSVCAWRHDSERSNFLPKHCATAAKAIEPNLQSIEYHQPTVSERGESRDLLGVRRGHTLPNQNFPGPGETWPVHQAGRRGRNRPTSFMSSRGYSNGVHPRW